jgi:putative ABC transport system permease protein
VRERINELAVLKTLGFGDRLVLALVLAESMVLAILGGGIGLGLIYAVTQLFDLGGIYLPALYMTPTALVQGIVLVIVLGLVAGALPALRAMRLNIADALRRT